MKKSSTLVILITVLFQLAACTGEKEVAEPAAVQQSKSGVIKPGAPGVQYYPERRALFGDLHVHTSWSTDAYAGMNRVGPRDAYRFARGEAVKLPGGIEAQLQVPLDFVALTDHAEGFDAIAACTYEDHSQYGSEVCQNMRMPGNMQADYLRKAFKRGVQRPAVRMPGLCEDVDQCLNSSRSTWQRVQAVANEFNEPGRFTALVGYEFSSLLNGFGMLHRNVIFRGKDVTAHAISSLDVNGQADFFSQLDEACDVPCEVLTIPHNTNYSWGLTFSRTDEDGSSYTSEDLERRSRIERLVEVTQQKGTSECQLGVGASDEDCNFGILFPPCKDGQTERCTQPANMVRNVLLDGIQLENEGIINPFKLGMIGSTDTHQSDPGNTNPRVRSRYADAVGNAEAVKRVLNLQHPVVGTMRLTSEGGLAAVWAESNTRSDVFDALRRREAYATSGTRLQIRFFAGDLTESMLQRKDAVSIAYQNGVPMGSELSPSLSPGFWVSASQDPNGATLDRIQVVKGWIDEGEEKHKVWDVACSADRTPNEGRCSRTPATVDVKTCARHDQQGSPMLQAYFSDPEFKFSERAFYYVRVLENPSCRWTTWIANSADVAIPDDVPATVQHRGWSSPIWIAPR